MATNYPTSLDALTNPTAGDSLTSPTHAGQHANANDAIEAIQTELGTEPSGASATVKARFEAIEANDWVTAARIAASAVGSSELADNAVDTAALQDGAVTTVKIADLAVTPAKLATTGRFTFPTGAANGYGFASGAVHLSGTGTPEGVITAAPGSTFLQTDSTTDAKGWLRWVKATGTGSTGWVAGAEADTGWRLVTASMSGWAGTNWMRRIGSQVTFQINATRSSDGGNYNGYTTLITAPTGFSPAGYLTAGLARTPVGLGYIWNTNGLTSIDVTAGFSGTWATGGSCYGQATWLTNAAWPSSLPGSAVV